jgi:hypothetical protein
MCRVSRNTQHGLRARARRQRQHGRGGGVAPVAASPLRARDAARGGVAALGGGVGPARARAAHRAARHHARLRDPRPRRPVGAPQARPARPEGAAVGGSRRPTSSV